MSLVCFSSEMKFEGINDDDIVISGVGLCLPDVNNLEDLNRVLFESVNPIKHDDSVVPVGKSVFIYFLVFAV